MIDEEMIIESLERCQRRECDDCTAPEASGYPWDCCAYDNFVRYAIEHLKAAKPREPIIEYGNPDGHTHFRCSNCFADLGCDYSSRFCKQCGREVKWE